MKNLEKYETLKVLPKSKRTKDNCNSCGVAIDNEFKVKKGEENV